MINHSLRRRTSGHSLVEMVVVVCMMSIGATLAARGTAPFYGMVGQMKDRAESAQELLMAREYLRHDLSGAKTALPTLSGTLLIKREEEAVRKFGIELGSTDAGIEYRFKDGKLYRDDHVYGESIVVADHVEGMTVTRVKNSETRIQIQDGTGNDAHLITLIWPK